MTIPRTLTEIHNQATSVPCMPQDPFQQTTPASAGFFSKSPSQVFVLCQLIEYVHFCLSYYLNAAKYNIYGKGNITDEEARALYFYTLEVSLSMMIIVVTVTCEYRL